MGCIRRISGSVGIRYLYKTSACPQSNTRRTPSLEKLLQSAYCVEKLGDVGLWTDILTA
jgi:hypothetical protein